MAQSGWSRDLEEKVRAAVPVGSVIATISSSKPNEVVGIENEGVVIQTERSRNRSGPQLVPGWMIQLGWEHLLRDGTLTNAHLLRVHDVRRSSAVCAILAQLPGVRIVSSRPIELALDTET